MGRVYLNIWDLPRGGFPQSSDLFLTLQSPGGFSASCSLPHVGRGVRLGGGDRLNLFLVVVDMVKDTHEGSAALGTGSSIPAALVDGTVWLKRTLLVQ